MKYARIERERRFLLAAPPDDLPTPYNWITDWYIPGTRLRLRRIETRTGELAALKFTQKYTAADAREGQTIITNFYLNEDEFERLRTLGGSSIRKQRFQYSVGPHPCAIDIFHGPLQGLLLAEIEFDSEVTMTRFSVPDFALAEVTSEPFFTGGHLACVEPATLQRELQRWMAAYTVPDAF